MNNLIGFSGKMTAGKTTMANKLVENYGFKRMAIGDEIKRVSNSLIEDVTRLDTLLKGIYNDKRVIEKYLEIHNRIKNLTFSKDKSGVYVKNEIYRTLTQDVAEVLRGCFGEEVWVNLFLNNVYEAVENGEKIVCDDIRLKSEYRLLKKMNFNIIRLNIQPEVQVERIKKLYNSFNQDNLNHLTEIDLDDVDFPVIYDTSADSEEETFLKIERYLFN